MAHRITLAIDLKPGSEPPTEFRVFKSGVISTSKGEFKFTAESGKAVEAAALEWGNDYPIDYEHASLAAARSADPAEAGKAAGWFKPEVRAGELWAAGVSWTPKAAEKLRAREFRYMSPTFLTDEDGQVVELLNVALTNLPATHDLTPLVASRVETNPPATPALKEPPMKTLLSKLGLAETATEAEAIVALAKLQDVVAATGKATVGEALGVIAGWKAAAEESIALHAKLAEQERAAQAHEIDELLSESVKAGRLSPASEPKLREVAKHGVEALKAALSVLPVTGKASTREPAPAPGASAEELGLSAEEREGCKKVGLSLKDYAAHKAKTLAARNAA